MKIGRWIAAACAVALVGGIVGFAAPLQLRYVVIVMRHGVRSPTWTADRLKEYSAEPWPDWGVPPGNLTPRGRELTRLLGANYGTWLSNEGVLRRPGCASAEHVYIWADTDQRTLETGRALGETLLPGCTVAVHSQADGDDPLFDPITAGLVKPNLETAAQAVRDRLGPQPQQFLESRRGNFETLRNILAGGAKTPGQVFESVSEISVTSNGRTVDLNGPLSTASTLTENFLLEYANGFQGKDLGWGRLDAANLARVLELHGAYADLMRRTPYLARARGSILLAHVLQSLQQAATGQPAAGALGRPGDTVLILAGHDTNLSNLSGMLDLSWKLPGYQTDETPPGGALVFSLWREATSGEQFVRTEFLAQTLDQMRKVEMLTLAAPPARQNVSIPACRADGHGQDADCLWTVFERVLQQAIDPSFVH